jgi:hypothetical protein
MENTHNNHAKGVTHEGQCEDRSASFHALVHKNSIEGELATLPSNGAVALCITATTDRGIAVYDVALPDDVAERNTYCYMLASRFAAEGATAAALSCTTVGPGCGNEHVCVLAVDHDGGEEAWTAQVIRSDMESPRIAEWERGEARGDFIFMLRASVGNVAGGGN